MPDIDRSKYEIECPACGKKCIKTSEQLSKNVLNCPDCLDQNESYVPIND